MSWRPCPFQQGNTYLTKKTVQTPVGSINIGEHLIFESEAYSRYDNLTVFTFRTLEHGEYRQWALHDDEPVEIWTNYFDPESAGAP